MCRRSRVRAAACRPITSPRAVSGIEIYGGLQAKHRPEWEAGPPLLLSGLRLPSGRNSVFTQNAVRQRAVDPATLYQAVFTIKMQGVAGSPLPSSGPCLPYCPPSVFARNAVRRKVMGAANPSRAVFGLKNHGGHAPNAFRQEVVDPATLACPRVA